MEIGCLRPVALLCVEQHSRAALPVCGQSLPAGQRLSQAGREAGGQAGRRAAVLTGSLAAGPRGGQETGQQGHHATGQWGSQTRQAARQPASPPAHQPTGAEDLLVAASGCIVDGCQPGRLCLVEDRPGPRGARSEARGPRSSAPPALRFFCSSRRLPA